MLHFSINAVIYYGDSLALSDPIQVSFLGVNWSCKHHVCQQKLWIVIPLPWNCPNVIVYQCWHWPLTYLPVDIILRFYIWHYIYLPSCCHHTWTISNTYFQCYCGSNISLETANLEHRLTWKVASPSPHVEAVTKWVPKNALKSWISHLKWYLEQKCKNHNTPHRQSYP